jgi:hypothetical protein
MRGGPVAKFGLWFALAICIGIFFADYAHRSAIRSVQQRRDALETEFKNRLPRWHRPFSCICDPR